MAKDYAKYHSKPKHSIEKGWVKRLALVIFVLLIATVSFSGFYLYKNKQNEMLQWVAKARSFFKRETKEVKVQEKKIVKTEPEIHFEFYTELPKMTVTHSGTHHAANTIAKPPASTSTPVEVAANQVDQKKNTYVLELGVFKDESEADEKRISLLLLGLEAVDLVKTPLGFKLQQGSFVEFAEAKVAQRKLKKIGIEAVIKKE